MTRYVVDTNVPIVANGGTDGDGGAAPSVDCQMKCIVFLQELLLRHRVLLDISGNIQAEYHRHLQPKGQPGVGDRFYLEILNSSPHRVERLTLRKRFDGEYEDIPQALIDAGFDPSDRKFAALASKAKAPVVNATDSDWLNHREVLEASGIQIDFICGCISDIWHQS